MTPRISIALAIGLALPACGPGVPVAEIAYEIEVAAGRLAVTPSPSATASGSVELVTIASPTPSPSASASASPTPSPSAAAAGSPTRLEVTGGSSLTAGACSGVFTLNTLDSSGAAVGVASTTTVALSGGGSGSFYADSSCVSVASSVVIASGASRASFYFKDTKAEALTLSAAASGLSVGTFAATVAAGTAASLSMTGSSSLTAGDCTGYTVTRYDGYGNAANAGSTTVSAGVSAGFGGAWATSSCAGVPAPVIASGETQTSFYFKDTRAEVVTISASASGLTGASTTVTVAAGVASSIFWFPVPGELETGVCHALTIRTRDSSGNFSGVANDIPINPSASDSSFYTDSRCRSRASGGSSFTIASGGNEVALYYRRNSVGSATLSFTGNMYPFTSTYLWSITLVSTRQVAAGRYMGCALTSANAVKCWGQNAQGQLGQGDTVTRGDDPGEMGGNLSSIDLGTNRSAIFLAAGEGTVCAITDTNQMKCWGDGTSGGRLSGNSVVRGDSAGEMGANLPDALLGSNRSARAISTTQNHGCVLLDDGTVKCFGYNADGRTGWGDTVNRGGTSGSSGDNLAIVDLGTGRTALAVAAGGSHSCAILDDLTAKCWGLNSNSQLGLSDAIDRGDGAGEMGNSLPTVSFGTNRTTAGIGLGLSHSCALLDTGAVKCWGLGTNGRLGNGSSSSIGGTAGDMGENLPVVNLGAARSARAIVAALRFTCALLDTYGVKCWGQNNSGQLGLGDNFDRGDAAGEMGDCLPVVEFGTNRVARQITASGGFACALLDDLSVKCWGRNGYGGLLGLGDNGVGVGGLADNRSRGDDAGEMGDSLPALSL